MRFELILVVNQLIIVMQLCYATSPKLAAIPYSGSSSMLTNELIQKLICHIRHICMYHAL